MQRPFIPTVFAINLIDSIYIPPLLESFSWKSLLIVATLEMLFSLFISRILIFEQKKKQNLFSKTIYIGKFAFLSALRTLIGL